MSNITLPRAVVEQVRETLEKSAVRFFSLASYISPIESVNGVKPSRGREDVIAALAALDAALAEPEPVHPLAMSSAHRLETAYSRIAAGEVEAEVLTEALGARGWVKREPATDEQIVKAGGECAVVDNEYLLDFRDGFRAAERFHGITKGDKT